MFTYEVISTEQIIDEMEEEKICDEVIVSDFPNHAPHFFVVRSEEENLYDILLAIYTNEIPELTPTPTKPDITNTEET